MPQVPAMPLRLPILVVEDSPALQSYFRLLLELDRYPVAVAGSGEEALAYMLRAGAPSLVLLDLELPGIDGLETLRRLRPLYPTTKVLMCSAVDDPEVIRRALALGAQGYLVKPVKHLYLSAALERCLAEDSPPLARLHPAAASLHLVERPH